MPSVENFTKHAKLKGLIEDQNTFSITHYYVQ